MMRHFNLGPASFETALVLNLLAVFFLIEAARRQAVRRDVPQDTTQNALLAGFFSGILGSRIGYGLLHWQAYSDDWRGWVALGDQGLHLEIGLIVAAMVSTAYALWRKIPLRLWLDVVAPGVGVLMIVVSFAFLAEGSVIGQPSDIAWRIELWGESRHPTQLYAAIGAFLTMVYWWLSPKPFSGSGFVQIIGGNAIVWLLLGFLLAEPSLLLNYRLVQVLAWGALIGVVLLWNVWSTPSIPESS